MHRFGDRVTNIHARVELDGDNTVDRLLERTELPKHFDLLSIDIDSQDWHVWYSLQNYLPTIVIIEIESSIPVGMVRTHRDGLPLEGSSFTATVQLGVDKGYTAVCHTGNLFFVRDDAIGQIAIPEIEKCYPELLFDYSWMPR